MNGYQILNIINGVSSNDVMTKAYIDGEVAVVQG